MKKNMKIAIGSDRRGYYYKEKLKAYLEKEKYNIVDVGPFDDKFPVDYPIYAKLVGESVSSGECDKGIVICSTGIGIMIACNKIKGIRCGMGYADEVARLMREHNDANVIAFGQDFMDFDDVKRRTDIFLNSKFLNGYHYSRIKQINSLELEKNIYQTPLINSGKE